MKYYIRRDLNEYGPYTLADLQRYVAQGNILLTDLTRSEGLVDWVPVSQVIGNIPIAVPQQAMSAAAGAYGGASVSTGAAYGGASGYGTAFAPGLSAGPTPPDFHWALVLLIGFVTCGLFIWVWLFVEAAFVKKIVPQSKGLLIMIFAVVAFCVGEFVNISVGVGSRGEPDVGGALLASGILLASAVLNLASLFMMRRDMQNYYTTAENIGLRLSGVMTFFFAVYYFQHHFSRIAQWKKTGILQPQG